jgi:hypothetical protein
MRDEEEKREGLLAYVSRAPAWVILAAVAAWMLFLVGMAALAVLILPAGIWRYIP